MLAIKEEGGYLYFSVGIRTKRRSRRRRRRRRKKKHSARKPTSFLFRHLFHMFYFCAETKATRFKTKDTTDNKKAVLLVWECMDERVEDLPSPILVSSVCLGRLHKIFSLSLSPFHFFVTRPMCVIVCESKLRTCHVSIQTCEVGKRRH